MTEPYPAAAAEPLAADAMAASADGWRGRLGLSFSPPDAGVLAGCVLERVGVHPGQPILLTHDGRAGGAESAAFVAAEIRARCADAEIRYLPHLPTPIASAYVAAGRAGLAILITASHNPADWNGVKVKVRPGAPLSGADEAWVDAAYRERRGRAAAARDDRAPLLPPAGDLRAAVDAHIGELAAGIGQVPAAGRRIVVDGLHGIAGMPMRRLAERLGYDVVALSEAPRADFGGLRPDPTLAASRTRCAQAVRRVGAELGLVLDGDGDRVIVLDHKGEAIQSQELMSLLIAFAPPALQASLSGDMLVTTTCGQMIRSLAKARGAAIEERAVGFKHISRLLHARPHSVGVGSVGDLGFGAFTTDRDPMATVMLLTRVLDHKRIPLEGLLSDLRRRLGLEGLEWFELHIAGAPAAQGAEAIAAAAARALGWDGGASETTVDGLRRHGPGQQWLLVRGSTTEGGCRVYGETDARDAGALARALAA